VVGHQGHILHSATLVRIGESSMNGGNRGGVRRNIGRQYQPVDGAENVGRATSHQWWMWSRSRWIATGSYARGSVQGRAGGSARAEGAARARRWYTRARYAKRTRRGQASRSSTGPHMAQAEQTGPHMVRARLTEPHVA
jgi:hypothetical protein